MERSGNTGNVDFNYNEAAHQREALKKLKILIMDACGDAEVPRAIDGPARMPSIYSLLKDAGCEVRAAGSTEQAMTELINAANTGRKFNLVISDYEMNGSGVCDFASAVNSKAELSGLKIIVTYPPGVNPETCLNCSICFAAHMVRPFVQSEVIGHILKISGFEEIEEKKTPSAPESGKRELAPEYKARARKLDILLVEDNEINRKLIGSVLKNRGYRFDLAADGKEALEKCLNKKYDVVFMDCQMPVMDGYESSRRISHEMPENDKPYIVAMTANSKQGDRDMCMKAGMDDYINKPIDFKLLFEILQKRACAKYGAGKGPLEINLDEIYETFKNEMGLLESDARELFFEYVDSLAVSFKKIENALNNKDFKTIRSIAHQLKGSAGSMKFDQLALYLVDFEEKAEAENFMECKAVYDGIKAMFE